MEGSCLEDDYSQEEEEEEEEEYDEEKEDRKRRSSLVAKWNKQASEQLKPTGSHMFVLTLETICHAHEPETIVVGVFNSKDAAVANSVTVQTDYGRFDSAIEDIFEDDHQDNRENPPDNGVLLQLGSQDTGEGDICRLMMNKRPVVGMESESQGEKKRARRR
jgi:hypothetical protein